MSANNLLLWMSARRQGSWQQFRAAVEELHVSDDPAEEGDDEQVADRSGLPIYQMLRLNLQRLGHAEFFQSEVAFEWRVSPPTLAVSQHKDGWIGLVIGARSRSLLDRLLRSQHGQHLERLTLASSPDQFRLLSPELDRLSSLAAETGLVLQTDAAPALLNCLPPIDDNAVRQAVALPFGADWRIERFDPAPLAWRPALRPETAETGGGLFRFKDRYRTEVLYCVRGKAFRVAGQVGKYLTLRHRRRRVIQYDGATRELSVPSICRPPFLIERALILCSGSLPKYERTAQGGVVHYPDISESIASMTGSLLRQELR